MARRDSLAGSLAIALAGSLAAALVGSLALALAWTAGAARDAHWGYAGDEGPARWAELSPSYRLCAEGLRQSPIDLDEAIVSESRPLVLAYEPTRLRIARHAHVVDLIDNGHTIQVAYDDGSTLAEGERRFELAQYHFHAPSEHALDGRRFPMEMHLVHQAEDGELAVLGVFIAAGDPNRAFDPIVSNLPTRPGEERQLEGVTVDIDDLLPFDATHFRYDGSLTTPPCSEGVRWFVLRQPVELSPAQIDAFRAVLGENARDPQPLHGRRVVVVKSPQEPDE